MDEETTQTPIRSKKPSELPSNHHKQSVQPSPSKLLPIVQPFNHLPITTTESEIAQYLSEHSIAYQQWFMSLVFHYFSIVELALLAKVCKAWRKYIKGVIGDTILQIQQAVQKSPVPMGTLVRSIFEMKQR
eukprot:TRINITY_DN786_c0_g2_i3.p1 TRINITY_DN786_c0_g2~~TRINITY_DN786_c0_g2_i3.p1  ORF type:complete len:131 (+),score=11.89 TRINITY_DN786_c0_g2_i3:85-477(+)